MHVFKVIAWMVFGWIMKVGPCRDEITAVEAIKFLQSFVEGGIPSVKHAQSTVQQLSDQFILLISTIGIPGVPHWQVVSGVVHSA